MVPPRARVLAVDDTPANLVALDAVLGRRYEFLRANSGREAIAMLQRDPNVDVILMDLQMPEMDGYRATELIKKIPGCEDIPVVFITAVYTEDPQVKRGYAAGAVDYFTKPFDPELLRLKVEVYSSFRHRASLLRARERQMRESEDVLRAGRKLASVLEGLPVGVIISDIEGRLCQTNEAILHILGSETAILTDAYGEILDWWRRDEARLKADGSLLAQTLASGVSVHNQIVRVRCLDGEMKSLLESTSPLRDTSGAVVGAVVVLRDVTDQQRYEADFEKRVAHLVSIGIELESVSRDSTVPAPE